MQASPAVQPTLLFAYPHQCHVALQPLGQHIRIKLSLRSCLCRHLLLLAPRLLLLLQVLHLLLQMLLELLLLLLGRAPRGA